MAASFPGAVKTFSAVVNGVTKLVAALFNSPYDEITAIETELGTDPAGSMTDLKTRLAVSMNDDGTLKAVSVATGNYSGTGAAHDIPHGLGRTPVFIMICTDDGGESFSIWFSGLTHGNYLGTFFDITVDGTNFTLGNVNGNISGRDYKFICW